MKYIKYNYLIVVIYMLASHGITLQAHYDIGSDTILTLNNKTNKEVYIWIFPKASLETATVSWVNPKGYVFENQKLPAFTTKETKGSPFFPPTVVIPQDGSRDLYITPGTNRILILDSKPAMIDINLLGQSTPIIAPETHGLVTIKMGENGKINAQMVPLCNGKENLCNRPYNKIAQLTSHNATSTTSKGFNPVADQNWDLATQLKKGIRSFKLPVHPVGKSNTPWATHTLQSKEIDSNIGFLGKNVTQLAKDELWKIDTTHIKFLDLLTQLKNFLEKNPREIVTLHLNVFDLEKMNDQFFQDFKTSGIDSYLYKHEQRWPTLEEMIKNGQRLVVFVDSLIKVPSFIYSKQWISATGDSYKNVADLNADSCDATSDYYDPNAEVGQIFRLIKGASAAGPAAPVNKTNAASNTDPNKLFLVQHFITGKVAGSASSANKANEYTVLNNRIQRCRKTTKRLPNFISVDFVDQRFDDLKRVIDEINSKEW